MVNWEMVYYCFAHIRALWWVQCLLLWVNSHRCGSKVPLPCRYDAVGRSQVNYGEVGQLQWDYIGILVRYIGIYWL